MPKRAKRLWERVLEWDNLLLASRQAARHKRYRAEVLLYNSRLEENLLDLRERLQTGQWHPGPYRELVVLEPKRRLVHAPVYADRVLHHALVQIICPYCERRFIDHSFACRKGKGTHAASNCLSGMLRRAQARFGRVYALKADISKYFYSIDHAALMEILARTVGDSRVLELMRRLVEECDCIEGGKGLPLGALTSQLMANIYLDQLDHLVKDELGVHFYLRYMDDFILLHGDKARLRAWLDAMRAFLHDRLCLTLNRKTGIFPIGQGVDFAGYRHWPDYKLPRKRNVKNAKKRFIRLSRKYAQGRVNLDRVRSTVASFAGYMKHCKGWQSAGSALEKLVLRRGENNP